MVAPQSNPDIPPLSATQVLLHDHKIAGEPESHLQHLALQIAHSLRYGHNWTDVRIHRTSDTQNIPLPRPMISGLPPRRLYVHPDEQIELLRRQKAQGKTGLPELIPEREWVLPCHLRERWTLKKFGEIFDAITPVPPARTGKALFESRQQNVEQDPSALSEEAYDNKWRTEHPKRVLLATLDDDSTVVYYIVHDGIVKPRQN